jgi:hypothetical protein
MRVIKKLIVLGGALLLSACALFEKPGAQQDTAQPVVEQTQCPELQCPEPRVIEKVVLKTVTVEPEPATTAGELHLPIVGAVEWAQVEPPGLKMEARIDTGAETTSIHAQDIAVIERDGKRHVQFVLVDPATGDTKAQELPLRRQTRIKQNDAPSQERYVVRMWLTLGEFRTRVDVTLSDRSGFRYPLLIGRNFLTDTAIVDVSRHHTQTLRVSP